MLLFDNRFGDILSTCQFYRHHWTSSNKFYWSFSAQQIILMKEPKLFSKSFNYHADQRIATIKKLF